MRLHEVVANIQEYKDIDNMLKRDCVKWLDETNGKKVYRGMRTSAKVSKNQVNKHRSPRETGRFVHDLLVKGFRQAGFSANRDNSIFCTGGYGEALDYGSVHVIFPIGDYSYTWSPAINDLYMLQGIGTLFRDFSADELDVLRRLRQEPKYQSNDDDLQRAYEVAKRLDMNKLVKEIKFNYKDTDLLDAIKSENEIMIDCNEFYAIELWYYKEMTTNLYVARIKNGEITK